MSVLSKWRCIHFIVCMLTNSNSYFIGLLRKCEEKDRATFYK